MKISRVAQAGAVIAVFLSAGTTAANAATVGVTGTTVETSPGTCGAPAWTGMVVHESGTETITGACVDGYCGTLDSTWHGSGRLDPETGSVILIEGEQRFTGGTAGLDGARGSVRFSLVGDGPATYEGCIVL